MKFNSTRFFTAFTSSAGLMAPVLLVVALSTTYFAASSLRAASTTVAVKVRSSDEQVSINLTKTQITEQQALRSAEGVARLSPSVRVTVAGKAIVISIASPEQFAEFMHALSAVQTTAADVVWEAEDICLTTCESGISSRARITGFKQSITTGA